MFKFTENVVRTTTNHFKFLNLTRYKYSTLPTAEVKSNSFENGELNKIPEQNVVKQVLTSKNSLVSAAFDALKTNELTDVHVPVTDNRILSAKTVDELLSISEGSGVARKHALKVISTLAEWSLENKVKLSDFEADPRFIRLCKVLTRGTHIQKKKTVEHSSEDLSTILSITAEDEAAKMVTAITLSQMVKVMSVLAYKKQRSLTLLRSLSFNITKKPDELHMKHCSDLMFSMANLNFYDENLLTRLSNDIQKVLHDNVEKKFVVSIATSLGFLKYKDDELLDVLCNWFIGHYSKCNIQDLYSLFLTLGLLNFESRKVDKLCQVLLPRLKFEEAPRITAWLDFVWALIILNKVTTSHVSSVLSQQFLDELFNDGLLNGAVKLKLLNIDAAAENLIPGYEGPRLPPNLLSVDISQSKEKQNMNMCLCNTLKNLISKSNIEFKVNTGMGFYIDAECIIDRKLNPVPSENYKASGEHLRIAFMMYEYQDMCKGRIEPTGINVLAKRLLESKGYNVLSIPYNEFSQQDRLTQRVQYLELKLKNIVQS